MGLSSQVLSQAHHVLSLSSLTLTHEMSALLFSEQLYRYLTVKPARSITGDKDL